MKYSIPITLIWALAAASQHHSRDVEGLAESFQGQRRDLEDVYERDLEYDLEAREAFLPLLGAITSIGSKIGSAVKRKKGKRDLEDLLERDLDYDLETREAFLPLFGAIASIGSKIGSAIKHRKGKRDVEEVFRRALYEDPEIWDF